MDGLDELVTGFGADTGFNVATSCAKESPKKGIKRVYNNCNVCDSDETMPGFKQCRPRKKSVDSIVSTLSKGQNFEGLQNFKDEREKAPERPPSSFASTVIEYEAKFPAKGCGSSRGSTPTDIVCLVNKHSTKTELKKGFRLEMMHEDQWIKFAVDTLVIPRPDAVSRWLNTKNATPDSDTDQKGPVAKPLRLPMAVADFIEGSNSVEQSKELHMESKRKKAGSADEVAHLQATLSSGHVNFNNAMFKGVGGSAAHALAIVGGSFLGARGEGAFSSSSPTKNIFAETLDRAEAEKKVKSLSKEAAPVDVEVLQVKTQTTLHDLRKHVEEKKKACTIACDKAKADSVDRLMGVGEVPNQSKYSLIMEDRLGFMDEVCQSAVQNTSKTYAGDDALLKVSSRAVAGCQLFFRTKCRY
jgi:hypothetical protein